MKRKGNTATASVGRRNETGKAEKLPLLLDAIPNPLPDNPVLSLVREALRAKGAGYIVLAKDRLSPEAVTGFFGDDLLLKLGRTLLDAITEGDLDFAKTVGEAIKAADTLFHRNRESGLIDRFIRYYCRLPRNGHGAPLAKLGQIKRGFEDEMNVGKRDGWQLSSRQWKTLRDAAWLRDHPREKAGRRK